MNTRVAGWISIVLGLSLSTPQAPPARHAVDVASLGPQVGARVPDFTLRDQHGSARTLDSIMGPMGAMLVFYRSADW